MSGGGKKIENISVFESNFYSKVSYQCKRMERRGVQRGMQTGREGSAEEQSRNGGGREQVQRGREAMCMSQTF